MMNATSNADRRFWREFLDLYHSLPETWDTKNPSYQNKQLKSWGYRRLLIKLTELYPGATIETLRKTIFIIRKQYEKEIKTMEQYYSYKPKLWFFDEIEFLQDAMPVENMQFEVFCNAEEITVYDEIFPQQKIEPFEESCAENDECSALGSSWAALYRKLAPDQQTYASKTISEVLRQGQLGYLNSLSYKLLEPKPEIKAFDNYNEATVVPPECIQLLEPKSEIEVINNYNEATVVPTESIQVINGTYLNGTGPCYDTIEEEEIKNEYNIDEDSISNKFIVIDESEEILLPEEMRYAIQYSYPAEPEESLNNPIVSSFSEKTEVQNFIETDLTEEIINFEESANDIVETVSNDAESIDSNDIIEDVDSPAEEESSSDPKTAKHEALKKEHTNMLFCKSLLDAYENNPVLWNNKLPDHKIRVKRKFALENVLQCVNKTCKELKIPEVTLQYVKKKIIVLRTGFKQELRNMTEKGIDETSLWYFDQLAVMIGDIAYDEQPNNDQSDNACIMEEFDESETIQMNLDFIEMYKSFPCLWDKKDPDYKNNDVKNDARQVMIKQMKERWSLELTPLTLHMKTLYMRALYAREALKRKENTDNTHTINTNLPEAINLYLERLSFLDNSTAREYQCEYCPLIFRSEKKYKYHRYTHDGTHPYICNICGKGFMRPANLKYHKNTHLPAKDRPFACDFCDAKFAIEVNRSVHMRRHTGQHVHGCTECNKTFASSTESKLHARLHTGEKPFVCETCGKGFRSNACFYHHRKKHSIQSDFKCSVCPKTFYRSDLLKVHMKIHSNIRDIVCGVCQKAFTTQKCLTQHMKLHDEVKRYVCKICNKKYAQAAGLSFHMKSHKNDFSE